MINFLAWNAIYQIEILSYFLRRQERMAYLKKQSVLGVVTTMFSDLPALVCSHLGKAFSWRMGLAVLEFWTKLWYRQVLELLSAEVRFVTLNREGISRILSDRGKECVLSQDNTAYSLASKIVNSLDNNTELCRGQVMGSFFPLVSIIFNWYYFN